MIFIRGLLTLTVFFDDLIIANQLNSYVFGYQYLLDSHTVKSLLIQEILIKVAHTVDFFYLYQIYESICKLKGVCFHSFLSYTFDFYYY